MENRSGEYPNHNTSQNIYEEKRLYSNTSIKEKQQKCKKEKWRRIGYKMHPTTMNQWGRQNSRSPPEFPGVDSVECFFGAKQLKKNVYQPNNADNICRHFNTLFEMYPKILFQFF